MNKQSAILTITTLLFFGITVSSQTDTTKLLFKGYKWNSPALRIGGGLQRSLNTEIGFAWIWHEVDEYRQVGNLIGYTSYEWFPIHNIQAIKGGCDMNANAGILGLEMKYQFDREHTDFVITPKIGFGAGLFQFCYGRNLSTNGYPFSAVWKNHFSILFNLTGKFFRNYRYPTQ